MIWSIELAAGMSRAAHRRHQTDAGNGAVERSVVGLEVVPHPGVDPLHTIPLKMIEKLQQRVELVLEAELDGAGARVGVAWVEAVDRSDRAPEHNNDVVGELARPLLDRLTRDRALLVEQVLGAPHLQAGYRLRGVGHGGLGESVLVGVAEPDGDRGDQLGRQTIAVPIELVAVDLGGKYARRELPFQGFHLDVLPD